MPIDSRTAPLSQNGDMVTIQNFQLSLQKTRNLGKLPTAAAIK
jgi:hypothetical protein